MKFTHLRIILLFLLVFICGNLYAFNNETLHYTITYKWGMIHKDAGKATLRITNSGNNYNFLLTAHTLPWADKVFIVRDTLKSIVSKNGFKVSTYHKLTHEGGKYSRDIINFHYAGSVVKGAADRLREKKDGTISHTTKQFSSTGPTFDMLSVFYFIRMVDWNKMRVGQTIRTTIFSGSKSETLTVKNAGLETIKLRNGTKRQAFKLNFIFTQNGGKKSSDNISAWVSTDSSHVPLYVVGKLPIGQVRVYLD